MQMLCPVKRHSWGGGGEAVLSPEKKPVLSQPAPDITVTVKPSPPPFRVNCFLPACFRAFSSCLEGRITGRWVLPTTKLLKQILYSGVQALDIFPSDTCSSSYEWQTSQRTGLPELAGITGNVSSHHYFVARCFYRMCISFPLWCGFQENLWNLTLCDLVGG